MGEVTQRPDKIIVPIQVGNVPKMFEVDTGSKFSLMNEQEFSALKLQVPIKKTNIIFRSYTKELGWCKYL